MGWEALGGGLRGKTKSRKNSLTNDLEFNPKQNLTKCHKLLNVCLLFFLLNPYGIHLNNAIEL